LKVHLDAMTRFAKAMDDMSSDCGKVRQQLLDADVTEDSFGMLPQSRDTAKVYEERTTSGLDVLQAGVDVFGDLGEGFRQMRDSYQAVDDDAAARLDGWKP